MVYKASAHRKGRKAWYEPSQALFGTTRRAQPVRFMSLTLLRNLARRYHLLLLSEIWQTVASMLVVRRPLRMFFEVIIVGGWRSGARPCRWSRILACGEIFSNPCGASKPSCRCYGWHSYRRSMCNSLSCCAYVPTISWLRIRDLGPTSFGWAQRLV